MTSWDSTTPSTPAPAPEPAEHQVAPLSPGIYLAGTPIGNLADATPRLIQALETAELIAAEDTRKTRQLAQALGITLKAKLVSNHDHNERDRVATLIEAARSQVVLVVSDAGMPVISDPGFAIVSAAREEQVPITCIPGPSAVTTALALSGVTTARFAFDGFVPRKDGERRRWLESLETEARTVCAFESPHRLAATLELAAEVLGAERYVAVARELTKKFEEVYAGPVGEVAQWAQGGVRGEIVVVISPAAPKENSVEQALPEVAALVDGGMRLKDACKEIASRYGLRAKELYAGMLEAR